MIRVLFRGCALACAVLCTTIVAFPQVLTWNVVRMSPSVMLTDLCMMPNGQTGYAVGSTTAGGLQLSAVYKTTNGGQQWSQVNFSGNTSTELQGVCFVGADTGWVVGKGGAVYATFDGGNTWQMQNSGSGRFLSKVHFVNSSTGWITGGFSDGSAYLVLKTTNRGATWLDLSFGTTGFSCEDVFFYDAMNGWIGGRDNTLGAQIHRTTDGGLSWSRQTVPVSASNLTVNSIDFPTLNKGWASTSSLYASPSGPILFTTDGGNTWSVQAYTNLHYNYCLDARDSAAVAIASVQILTPASERVFMTTNGGLNWFSASPPILSYTSGIQFVGPNIWIAADQSQILRTSTLGTSWESQLSSPLWRSVTWSSLSHGWVVAGTNVGIDGACLRTTNGGASWFADRSAPGGAQVTFANPSVGWMLWEGNSPSVWKTTNAGNSWTQHAIPAGAWIGRLTFATVDSGWGYGSNGAIRFTSNGGLSWVSQTSGTSYYIQAMYFVNTKEGWAAGGYGSGNGFILRTTNGGANWSPQTPALSAQTLHLFFLNQNEGWACGVGGVVQKTTDGGLTWQAAGQVSHGFAERIMMKTSQTGWLVARNAFSSVDDGRGFIYRTDNGAASWTLEWAGTWPKSSIGDIALQNGTALWACGQHNTVLRYELPSAVPGEEEIPRAFRLYQNYPNPFNATTHLGFVIGPDCRSGRDCGLVSLKVYDVLGREVATLVNEVKQPGRYTVQWDASAVASGVYVCRMVANTFTAQRKLVLLR